MCREKSFQTFLSFRCGHFFVEPDPSEEYDQKTFDEREAAARLRNYLDIDSRSDLLDDDEARAQFKELIIEYRLKTRDGQQ